jgi:hypothetical protein
MAILIPESFQPRWISRLILFNRRKSLYRITFHPENMAASRRLPYPADCAYSAPVIKGEAYTQADSIALECLAYESLQLVQNSGNIRLAFGSRIDYRRIIQLAPIQLAGKFLSEGIIHLPV